LKRSNAGYIWRDGNQFELLIDGQLYFQRMLQTLEAAEDTILLEMYLFESGVVANQFIRAFCDAADRGVAVYLLLDDYGCTRLKVSDRQKLERRNISFLLYNPIRLPHVKRALLRDHRKLLIVDSSIAFVGGTGITDQFSSAVKHDRAWRDTMVQISGPCVLDWLHLFKHTWDEVATDSRLNIVAKESAPVAGEMLGRVTCSDSLGRREIKRSFIKRIRNAEHTIWIATAYFVPSMKIRRALIQAARNGVDVRLLLPGKHTDHPAVRHAGRRFYYSLLNAGVRVFEYQPRFTHSKVLMCDVWVSIGSSNFDRWNMRWNLEANQEIEDGQLVKDVMAMLQADFEQSKEVLLGEWRNIPWYHRLAIWFWGRIDIWLDRLTHGWRKK